MKKYWIIFALATLLSGCSGRATFEQVTDQLVAPVGLQMRKLEITLPKEAAKPTLIESEGNEFYVCDGYTISIQTLDGGDLDATMRALTGFSKEQLTVMETQRYDFKRYDCVWSAAGEGGDHVARAVILDDGHYHYAVTVMADFASAGELSSTWKTILDSVSLKGID